MTFFKVPFLFIFLVSLNLLFNLVSTKRSGSTSSISSSHDVNHHHNLLQPKIEQTSSNPIETDLKLGNGENFKRKRPIEDHLASTATSKAPKRESSPSNDATTLRLGRTHTLPSTSSSSAAELGRSILHAKYRIKKEPVDLENDHFYPSEIKSGPSKGISRAERNRKSPSQEMVQKVTSNELKRQILSKPKSQKRVDLSKLHRQTNTHRSKSHSSGNEDDNKDLSLSLRLRKRGIENVQQNTSGNGNSHPTIPPNHILSHSAQPQTGVAQVRTGGPIRNNNHGLMIQVNHPYNRMAQIQQQQQQQISSPYGATRLMGTNVQYVNTQNPHQIQNVLHHIRTAQIQGGKLRHTSGIPIQIGHQQHGVSTPVGRGGGPHFLTQPPHLVNSPRHPQQQQQPSTEHSVPVQQQIRIEHTLPSLKPVGPTQDLLGKVGQGSPPRQSYVHQPVQQHNSEHNQPNLNLSLGSGVPLRSFCQSSPRSKLDLSLS